MPADAPGVTTDDHQPRSGGDGGTSSAPAGDGEPGSSQTAPSRSTPDDAGGVPGVGGVGDADESATGAAGATGAADADAPVRPAGFAPELGPMTATEGASTSVPDPDPLSSPFESAPVPPSSPETSSFGSDGPATPWADPIAPPTPSDPAAPADPSESGAADDPADPSESGGAGEHVGDPGPESDAPSPAGGEPPPAPVLVPPGRQLLRGRLRGRHTASRADRASRRGLSVNQRLWSISPWSVFKVSALFYICVGLIVIVAGTLLYNAGRSVGTIEQAESFVSRMGAYGECMPTADVPEGTEFQEDDDKCSEGEVLVGGFTLDDGTLFRAAAIGVGILVVAGSIGNVLLIVLLNLLNELTGGLRHTIIKEPVARPPGSGSPRSPGGQSRSPRGSPRGQPQR